jgi:hypothetical protein
VEDELPNKDERHQEKVKECEVGYVFRKTFCKHFPRFSLLVSLV